MTVTEKDTKLLEGGIVLIDKPYRWTSFDVVNKVRSVLRKYYGIRKLKVGHAGTLDPLATGLVLVCTGKMTKEIHHFQALEKEYIANIEIGSSTPSFDLETEIDHVFESGHITRSMVESVLEKFIGEIDQIPPLFSAKFIDGKRAYKHARRGDDIELPANRVTINELILENYQFPNIALKVICSKGTYIRSLARDIGTELNSGAHLSGLRRTRIGELKVENGYSPEQFENIFK